MARRRSSENLCHVHRSVARCLQACPKRQKNLFLWQNLDVLTLTLWAAWFSYPPYLKAVPEIGKYLQIYNFCPQAPGRPPLSLVSLAIELVLFQCSYFVFQFSFESQTVSLLQGRAHCGFTYTGDHVRPATISPLTIVDGMGVRGQTISCFCLSFCRAKVREILPTRAYVKLFPPCLLSHSLPNLHILEANFARFQFILALFLAFMGATILLIMQNYTSQMKSLKDV